MIGPDQLAAALRQYNEFADAIGVDETDPADPADQVVRILTGLGVDEAAARAAASELFATHLAHDAMDAGDLGAYAAGWVDGFFLGIVAARTETADNTPGGLAAPPDAPTT